MACVRSPVLLLPIGIAGYNSDWVPYPSLIELNVKADRTTRNTLCVKHEEDPIDYNSSTCSVSLR